MARLLIHWHPQGSFIARSFIESLSLLGIRQLEGHSLYVLPGPSFMNQTLPDIKKRLVGPLSLFPQSNEVTIFDKFYNFQVKGPAITGNAEYLHCDYISSQLHVDRDAAMLLSNAISDTLHRGCLRNYQRFKLYREWGKGYWRRSYIDRLSYVLKLYKSYVSTISSCRPDIVVMSHPNYDIYIALYIAARSLGIPSLVVNGGYHLSYLCLADNKLIDPSPQSARASLLDAYCCDEKTRLNVVRYLKSRGQEESPNMGHLKESPIEQLQKHYEKLVKRYGHSNELDCQYILFMPILGEVNHHDCLADLVFGSKPSWINETIKQLSDMGISCFYYRHHPLVDSYSERKIVERLIKMYAEEYLVKAVNISGQSDFYNFLDQCVESRKVAEVLALGGNISTELAANGIRPIVANPCFASAGKVKVRNQLEIRKMVKLEEIYTDGGAYADAAIDIRRMVAFTGLIGKGHSYDHSWRKGFDNRYFFGKSNELYNPEIILDSYQKYLSQFYPSFLGSSLGLHYYTDLAGSCYEHGAV